MKVCSKCKLELGTDSFTKDVTKKDGLKTACRECQRIVRIDRASQLKELVYSKICTDCKLSKDTAEFRHNWAAKDGLHSYCRECDNNRLTSRRAANKAKYQQHYLAKQRAKAQARPTWVDKTAIAKLALTVKKLNSLSKYKYSLDHIDPIQHDLVCGLDIPANLRLVTQIENSRKGNTFVPYGVDINGDRYELF